MLDLIKKKRDGLELDKKDYGFIIEGLVDKTIPDYQLAAFLMAVYFKGLNHTETAILTEAMMRSGDVIDLSKIPGIKVDKHSTGGVGDKTTLILAPLVAAAGVPVAKMSGRGLGHTGGTLDKLESIPGFSVEMSREQFINQVKESHIAICGQSNSLAPADKKFYALRDVTGTVDNISLISSSIMSKKLACGADAIVIDIKVGSGAYMKTVEDAEALAEMLIGIGRKMDRKIVAIISAMDEPLGYAVGNALEVKEAIDTLHGKGPKDLEDLCMELGSQMLLLCNQAKNREEGIRILKQLIDSGAAFKKFKELTEMQGGDPAYIENPERLPRSAFNYNYCSKSEGFIATLDALQIGLAAVKLGAGRTTKESVIEKGAGILLKKKCGDYVKKGEVVATMFSNEKTSFLEVETLLDKAYSISRNAPLKKPLIIKTIFDA